jgi:cysteine desulfurase
VLLAMGLTENEARCGVRFSLGRTTTDAEIDSALAVIPAAVAALSC